MSKPAMTQKPEANQILRLEEGNIVELAKAESSGSEQRSFSMLAYTGAIVQRWFGRLVFDLSGIEYKKDATPILKNHNEEQIVGISETIDLTPGGILIKGKISRVTAAAKEVTELSDEKFKWQASPGLAVLSVERLEPDVKTTVNGNEVTGPLYIVRKSQLRESSFVPVGADGDTSGVVLSFFQEEVQMSDKSTPAAVDAEAAKKDVLNSERKRVEELKAAFPKDPEFALSAVSKGLTVIEAKAEYSDKLQKDLDARNTELAAEKAKKQPGKVEGGALVTFGGEGGGSEGDKDFMQLADDYRAKHSCSAEKAMSEVSRLHPDTHSKYVEKCRASKPREIVRESSK